MLQRITICTLSLILSSTLFAQAQNFKKLPSGLEYKFLQDIKKSKKATIGSSIEIHIKTSINDSVIFNSYKLNNKKPVPAPVQKPAFNCDLQEGFAMMSVGDHAIFRAPVDSVYRNPQQRPAAAKSGDIISFDVTLVSVKTAAEIKAQNAAAQAKEGGLIKAYLKKNNLKAQKTASGLYYIITKKGTGPNAKPGQTVSMNYTGKLLDETVFDSNVLPKFGHTDPFKFPLGQGRVIKGWDEGIALLNKGSKAKLIIPSALAYGSRAMPGNANNKKGIPANSVLVFDVEMLGTEAAPKQQQAPKPVAAVSPEAEDKMIKEYIKKNKLKAVKTASGLYYVMKQVGKGPNAQKGQTVNMNYTGYLLDGSIFDSNILPKFGHVQPFSFPLGQGRVIKGWDEGVALLKTGGVAKLIIPSYLAYGSRAMPGNKNNPKGIPANSILVFDVEMLGTK